MLKPVHGKDIQLLLDQYGAKQTSLPLLRNMPIDLIRLDAEIIENCVEDQGQLIKAISSLAHELNISVVANNVKNESQIEVLKSAKVDYAQGPGASQPIDEQAVMQLLKDISNKNS